MKRLDHNPTLAGTLRAGAATLDVKIAAAEQAIAAMRAERPSSPAETPPQAPPPSSLEPVRGISWATSPLGGPPPEIIEASTLQTLGTVNGKAYWSDPGQGRELRADYELLREDDAPNGAIVVRVEQFVPARAERPMEGSRGGTTVHTPARVDVSLWQARALPAGSYAAAAASAERRVANIATGKANRARRDALALARRKRWGDWMAGRIGADELLADD